MQALGASESPYNKGALHKYTYPHCNLFSYLYERCFPKLLLYRGYVKLLLIWASQSHYSLWGVSRTPYTEGICTHIHTFGLCYYKCGLFPKIPRGFVKPFVLGEGVFTKNKTAFARQCMNCPHLHRKRMVASPQAIVELGMGVIFKKKNIVVMSWIKCPDLHRQVMFSSHLSLIWVGWVQFTKIKRNCLPGINEMPGLV